MWHNTEKMAVELCKIEMLWYTYQNFQNRMPNEKKKEQESKVGKLVGGAQMHQLMKIEHLFKLERTIFEGQYLENNICKTIFLGA